MEKGRRRPKRKKVEFDDVVPSTDLPPLVEGELRCFLCVTLGRLTWGNITPSRTPPVCPAYVRLRWWGEASDGTLFRPVGKKEDSTVIKSRAQFGIRSGPKQMTAYFNDMGSITLDVLSSPKSVPIGRVQVPNVASLTSSNPIRGFYPIVSTSSRKLGEVQVSMSFKPLRSAYDEYDSVDTISNSSYSSRSRNASACRGGSRQSSRSRPSSVGSARSRSSSAGSYRQSRGRSRSNKRSKAAGRQSKSRSHDGARQRQRSSSRQSSKNHQAEESHPAPTVDPAPEAPTPRGIDAMLEQNGHDLYALGLNLSQKPDKAESVGGHQQTSGIDMKAIQDLLERGRRLRDEITRSALSAGGAVSRMDKPVNATPSPPSTTLVLGPTSQVANPDAQSREAPVKLVEVLKEPTPVAYPPKVNTDLRIVDMVLRAKGLKDELHLAEVSSVGSNIESLVSDLEDPLHDDSVLQQLLYNNTGFYPNVPTQSLVESVVSEKKDNQDIKHPPLDSQLSHGNQNQSSSKTSLLSSLNNVHLARITIKAVQLRPNANPSETTSAGVKKKGMYVKVKPDKPPVPSSPQKNQKNPWTYFVEYTFPFPLKSQRSATTSHEVTRVVSRKIVPGGLVKFDQHTVFPMRFTPDILTKWMTETVLFQVYAKNSKSKKVTTLGSASLALRHVVDASDLSLTQELDILHKDKAKSHTSMTGCLVVSVDLAQDSKDLQREMSPVKKLRSVQFPNAYSVTKTATAERNADGHPEANAAEAKRDSVDVIPPGDVPATVLYLYVMLKEARDIPATRPHSSKSGRCNFPSAYLVCRNSAAEEPSRSHVVWNTSNPKFNFTQTTPVKITGALFKRLRDNFMVVEVWTRVRIPGETDGDKLIGLVKIPLDIFYQSLRDEEIARAVLDSEYPMISVDSFQPIVDLFTGHSRGKLMSLVALGSLPQIEKLRKMKESETSESQSPRHRSTDLSEAVHPSHVTRSVPRRHEFEIKIHCLQNFKPLDNQVWGETDCFVQYQFPTVHRSTGRDCAIPNSEEENGLQENSATSFAMATFRTDTTLCVPNPRFDFARSHVIQPPDSVPVQRVVLGACSGLGKYPGGSVPFEVWSRYYYPNMRDQLLAKGCLPAAKLCALVSMERRSEAEQTFDVPLRFVDTESGAFPSAGDLRLTVKHKASADGRTEPPAEFSRSVKLEVAVLRACGLQTAADLAASLSHDVEPQQGSHAGVNSYAMLKVSFQRDEKPRLTRCVPRSFAPDYAHHFEVMCPLVRHHDDVAPITLAELLANGEVDVEIWNRSSPGESRAPSSDDVLLGRVTVPTVQLLTRTTGIKGWFPITSIESLQRKSIVTVGGLELAITFPCQHDHELLLRAAASLSWRPPAASDLNRLLTRDSSGIFQPVCSFETTECLITANLTVTNAWLSKKTLSSCGGLHQKASVYLRYKFFDHDSVISSLCPVMTSQKQAEKERDPMPVRLAHRRSFLCKSGKPLIWYFREELMEVQVWSTNSRSRRTDKRPLDEDFLLGTAQIDFTPVLVGGLHKQQHTSALYPLFKAGCDDLRESCLRIYLSVSPGNHIRPNDFETEEEDASLVSTSDYDITKSEEKPPEEKKQAPANSKQETTFSAIVSVEKAMHLPLCSPGSGSQNPGCYVSFTVVDQGLEGTRATRIVSRSSSPCWNHSADVTLDRNLLREDGKLIFRVWHRESFDEEQDDVRQEARVGAAEDRMIGFAAVDISILRAGFNVVNGWYNVMDIHGGCQGQIKVAVTPTEPVQTPYPLSPVTKDPSPKGLLRSVPLITPIQTPSGSMYLPCVSSSQTVGTTCRLVTTSAAPTSYSNPTTNVVSSSVHPPYSSRSLFRKDQQQTCLMQTLQKQMMELDAIKESFERRSMKMFAPLPKETSPQVESLSKTPPPLDTEPFSVTFQDQVPVKSQEETSEEAKDPPLMSSDRQIPASFAPPEQDDFSEDVLTTSYKPNKHTVHMSLFKSPNEEKFQKDDALSDNDMEEFELVCPKNLNQQSFYPSEALSPVFPGPPKQEEGEEDARVLGESGMTTISGSELDNTSLWFSGASQVLEDTVEEEEDLGEKEVSRKLFEDTDAELEVTKEDKKDPPEIKEHLELSVENEDQASKEERSGIKDAVDAVQSYSEKETSSGGEDHEMEDVGEEIPPLPSSDEKSEDTARTLESSNPVEAGEDDQPSEENEKEEDIPQNKDDDEEKGIPQGRESDSSGAGSDGEIGEDPSKKVLEDISNDRSAPSGSAHPRVPSFFPPSRDLVANMRSLQAITTQQKRHLKKQEQCDDSSEREQPCSSARARHLAPDPARKRYLKPSESTDEQTKRLARIFNSKFTSG